MLPSTRRLLDAATVVWQTGSVAWIATGKELVFEAEGVDGRVGVAVSAVVPARLCVENAGRLELPVSGPSAWRSGATATGANVVVDIAGTAMLDARPAAAVPPSPRR